MALNMIADARRIRMHYKAPNGVRTTHVVELRTSDGALEGYSLDAGTTLFTTLQELLVWLLHCFISIH